jgi:NAD(P)-dependent dehydrogenase (short-subunit alcohol dehydrogenase family)
MNPTYDFAGQVALVTGAGSGLGLGTAQAFAEAGASVVLADMNEDALRAATDGLTVAGHTAIGVTCDVSDEEEVAALVAHTVASFGRLDMAFNNAGIMIPPSDAADEPADNFDRVDAINLRGVWACMKHELARAPSSTARLSAASSGSPAALRITPPSTACSGLRRAPRSNTRRAASASTQSARARSTRRWSPA